jgi:hypothetical protein
VGGFPGIHDMNLNVAEWEDNCQGSSSLSDSCAARGGAFNGNSQTTCAMVERHQRNFRSPAIGFRCCL